MFCSETLTTWFCTLVIAVLLPALASADPLDNDCDGWYDDQGDCDDWNAAVYPGAPELYDGVDNDCDAQIDEGCPGINTCVTLDFDVDPSGSPIAAGQDLSEAYADWGHPPGDL
ncbi:MAG: putative metal-binding motif-containing protein [Myxococcota bacterium]|jgi:hypothetical protein|nr:putative metal-binding motif-containing protein [Myxococcota bacterium]